MGILRDLHTSVSNNTLDAQPAGAVNGVAAAGGAIAGTFVKGVAMLLPGALGGALRTGIANAGLSQLLGEVFMHVPLAGLQQRLINTFKEVGSALGDDWGKADQAAHNYAKNIGLSADQAARLRDEMIKFTNEASLSNKYNKSLEELIKLQQSYSSVLGRNIQLTNQQTESLAAMSAIIGDDMAVKFSSSLENFGLSTTAAGDKLTQMFNKSLKQGISLEKYAKNVTDHLSMAQKYTFKRGLDGLTAMAEKATKLRIDMDMVASLAENLGDVEKSVNVSAQLQVLGGPFAQFADPMGLLHDSLNDMEGLQDRLSQLTNSLGHFNRQTGEIEIATFDKMRLRAAASAMGISYDKLIEQTTTQARRNEIEYQMKGLSNIPDEYKELLKNTATFENGIAGVRGSDGKFTELSNLGTNDFKSLVDLNKSESQNIADIAQMLRGYFDVQEGTKKQIESQKADKFAKQAQTVKNTYDAIGKNAEAINKLIMIEMASRFINPMFANFGRRVSGAITRTMFKMGHAEGGLITDGLPGKEMILNSAQNGEFVVNKASTEQYLPLLSAMNKDKTGSLLRHSNGGIVKKYSEGGVVGSNASIGMLGLATLGTSMMGYGMMNHGNMGYGGMGYGMIGFNPQILQQFKGVRGFDGVTGAKTIDKLTNALNNQNRMSSAQIRKQMAENAIYQKKIYDRALRIKYPNMGPVIQKMGETQDKVVRFMGKTQNKIMNFVGSKVGGGVIGAAMGGISAAVGYSNDNTWVMNKGRAVGGTIGATAGGLIGGALGSMIGPMGTMLGAAAGKEVGKVIGEFTGKGNASRRNKHRNKIYEELTNEEGKTKFSTLRGNFSVSELRNIAQALGDGQIQEGEIGKKLEKKMETLGNQQLLDYKKYAGGGLVVGRPHSNGGVLTVSEGEGGEYFVSSAATKNSIGLLNKINSGELTDSNFSSLEPMGKFLKVMTPLKQRGYAGGSNAIRVEPITINLGGTLKLEGVGGQSIDLSKELINNPTFIRKLTDLISMQININENGGFDKDQYFQRYANV